VWRSSFRYFSLSVTFNAFIFGVLNIMPRWRHNSIRPMRLNIWERSNCWCFLIIVKIWWFIFICKYFLYSIPYCNRSLATRLFTTSVQYWLACPVSFIVANLTFSASKNGYQWKYMFILCSQYKKAWWSHKHQNSLDDHKKLVHP